METQAGRAGGESIDERATRIERCGEKSAFYLIVFQSVFGAT